VLLLQISQLQGIQVPSPPRGYGTSAAEVVVDAAGVLPQSSIDRINRIAFDVHEKSGGEMAVVTLPDIGLRAEVDVAIAIGRAWGVGANAPVGQRSRNAGVVILVVPKETSSDGRGHCFITTGRGTEGFITDADAGALCRQAIPYFQQRQYGPAMELLATSVAEEFAREFGFTLDTASIPPQFREPDVRTRRVGGGGGLSPSVVLVLFVVAFVILSSLGRRRRGCGGCIPIPIVFPTGGGYHSRGGWGGGWGGGFGGGGGGGFGGFGGGGGFSGGGGGSNW
jgi:uncharacterized protein